MKGYVSSFLFVYIYDTGTRELSGEIIWHISTVLAVRCPLHGVGGTLFISRR